MFASWLCCLHEMCRVGQIFRQFWWHFPPLMLQMCGCAETVWRYSKAGISNLVTFLEWPTLLEEGLQWYTDCPHRIWDWSHSSILSKSLFDLISQYLTSSHFSVKKFVKQLELLMASKSWSSKRGHAIKLLGLTKQCSSWRN